MDTFALMQVLMKIPEEPKFFCACLLARQCSSSRAHADEDMLRLFFSILYFVFEHFCVLVQFYFHVCLCMPPHASVRRAERMLMNIYATFVLYYFVFCI